MYTSVIIALKYIFVIVVNTCVGRGSVDNKAAILSYPILREGSAKKEYLFFAFRYMKGQGFHKLKHMKGFGKSVIADCERTYKG